ncbi:MAG: hypothetical protein IKZ66_04520, partial [Schwartzia sp.]|nr:hypothetical protein [Schwartzia sp. (in: firmicutes)]
SNTIQKPKKGHFLKKNLFHPGIAARNFRKHTLIYFIFNTLPKNPATRKAGSASSSCLSDFYICNGGEAW